MIYNAGYFQFGDVNSSNYNVFISGGGTFDAPDRDIEFVSIDGRNGDLAQDNGRFQNIEINYPAFISRTFLTDFDQFRSDLYLQRGYQRLWDSYHPLEYRMAVLRSGIKPDTTVWNRGGKFDITFNCKPQRFLIDGSEYVTYYPVSNGGFDASGANEDDAYTYRIEYFPVTPGETFKASAKYIDTSIHSVVLTAAFYNSSKTFISLVDSSAHYVNDWEQGNIRESNGTNNNTATTRCRTNGVYNFDGVSTVTVTVPAGFKLTGREYSGTPWSEDNYVGVNFAFTTGTFTFTPVDGHYYRFAIGKTNDSTLSPSGITENSVVLTYSGLDQSIDTTVPAGAAYARVMYGAFASTTKIALTIENNGVVSTYGDGGALLVNPTGYVSQPIISAENAKLIQVQRLGANNNIVGDITKVTVTDYSSTGRTDCVINSVIGDAYSEELGGFQAAVVSLNPYVTITENNVYSDYPTFGAGANIILTATNADGTTSTDAFTSCKIKAGWWHI